MKKRGCVLMLLAALALVGIGALAYLFVRSQERAQSLAHRPLVLIHSPIQHAQVHVGSGVHVHATAWEESGLRGIELWADGAFVGARDADGAPSALTFAGSWVPVSAGGHTLVVRAFASDGTEGQATVMVDALPQEAADLSAEVEPGTPAGEGEPGGEPGGEGAPAGEGEPSGEPGGEGPPAGEGEPGGEPPAAEGEPPARGPFLWEFPLFDPPRIFPFLRPGQPVGLRVEILSLSTPVAYEGLHCYVGLGNAPPRWFPDADGDPTTDESFAVQSSGALTEWDVARHFAGNSAPVVTWLRETPVSLSVLCVGISAGGTEATELERWEGTVPPEEWTGMIHTVSGRDMTFSYRITRIGLWDMGERLELDFDMTPPSNLRIQQSDSTLRWDYLPRPGEASIEGFRIYLNGSLQWVEPARARQSTLPREWLHPPCGTTYRFEVTAYRSSGDELRESPPASAFLEQPAQDCQRTVAITFVSLRTFDLPGDGDSGDRTGDIGPAYGFFWANDQRVTFSGGHLGSGLEPLGLRRYSYYSLSEMASRGWNFSDEPSLVVPVPPGGTFEFGFRVDDEDSGRCRDADDRGCDDLICEGFSSLYQENDPALSQNHEETLLSEDGRCQVTVQWGPAAGSPVGSATDWEPLPWLDLEHMFVDESSGRVSLNVRNTGTAAWPGRDLNIELQSRDGLSLGIYTWPGFTLGAGERITLTHPDMVLSAPFDACVVIDPYDDVLEAHERSGALYHHPICAPLPDLIIAGVQYDFADGGKLRVIVQNVGEGALRNRTLALSARLLNGIPISAASWPHITLEPGQAYPFELTGVGDMRTEMRYGGYSVIVNPETTIVEAETGNNAYSVASYTLQMWWCDARIPNYAWRWWGSTARMFLTAEILSGEANWIVWEAARSSTLGWDASFHGRVHFWEQGHSRIYFSCGERSEPFVIMGDELLRVSIQADFQWGWTGPEDLGTETEIYDVHEFSGFPFYTGLAEDTFCDRVGGPPASAFTTYEEELYWNSHFCIGRIAP